MFEIDDTDFDLQTITNATINDAFEINVSLNDIQRAIRRIKSNGSKGPDNIHPRVIHECADSLVWPI